MNVIKEGVKQGKNEIQQFSLEQMKAQVMISKLEKRLREDLTNHDSTLIGQVCDESLGLNLGTGSNLLNLISCQVKYEGIVSYFEAASLAGKTMLQMSGPEFYENFLREPVELTWKLLIQSQKRSNPST